MKAKRLYIAPAMYAHKLKFKTSILGGSTEDQTIGEGQGSEDINVAKRSRFSAYDGFGTKSEESSSDAWK